MNAARRQAWLRYSALFAFLLAANYGVNQLVGAPFMSPDSTNYLLVAETAKFGYKIGFGDWQPPWFAIFCMPLFALGLGPAAAMTLIGSLLQIAVIFLVRQVSGRRWLAALAGAFFFFSPQWVMLRASFWSETLFAFHMVLVAAILTLKLSWRWLCLAVGIAWLFVVETRHAGMFVLPAIIIALTMSAPVRAFKQYLRAFMLVAAGFIGVVAISNTLKTGSPAQTTTTGVSCIGQFIVINPLPYCDWDPEQYLCKQDPKRLFVGRADTSHRFLLSLLWDPKSPVTKARQEFGPEGYCVLPHEIMKASLLENPLRLLGLTVQRLLNQLGSWDETERGVVKGQAYISEAWFKSVLDVSNYFQGLHIVALGFIFYGIVFIPQIRRSPVVMFLLLAGLGHAAGISLVNPFLALRYMAMSKILVTLAFVVCLALSLPPVTGRLAKNKD